MAVPRKRRSIGIVGAGPGGLAAAMLLARRPVPTSRSTSGRDRLGGRSAHAGPRTAIAAGRFRFDMGPTFFLYPARARADIFAACGREVLEDEVELMRLDPQVPPDLRGGRRDARHSGPGADGGGDRAAQPARRAGACRNSWRRTATKLAAFRPVLENGVQLGCAHYLRPDVLRSPASCCGRIGRVDSDLASHFDDERVRLAFSFQSQVPGYVAVPLPEPVHHPLFHGIRVRRVPSPKGGTGAVMAAMADVAERPRRQDIRLNEPVRGDPVRGQAGGRACARTRGDVRHDAMVVNADFAARDDASWCRTALRRRWTDRRIDTARSSPARRSCSTSGLDGAQRRAWRTHTIYLSKDYRRNVAEIEARRRAADRARRSTCRTPA